MLNAAGQVESLILLMQIYFYHIRPCDKLVEIWGNVCALHVECAGKLGWFNMQLHVSIKHICCTLA